MTVATTFNPADSHLNLDLTNGNRTIHNTHYDSYGRCARCSDFVSEGKFYAEFLINDLPNTVAWEGYCGVGFGTADMPLTKAPGGADTYGLSFFIDSDFGTYGAIRMSHYGITTIWEKPSAPALYAGDIIQVAIDIAAGDIWVGVNNFWQGDPAAGTGAAKTGWQFGESLTLVAAATDSSQVTLNADPPDQTYTPPSGFTAKWHVPHEGDVSGAIGAADTSESIREFHLGITAGTGGGDVPWKWYQDGGVGGGEVDDNPLLGEAELAGIMAAFNQNSPIAAGTELDALVEMFRGHYPYLAQDPNVGLGATLDQELQYNSESVFVGMGCGAEADAFNFSEFIRTYGDKITKRYEMVLTGHQNGTTDKTIPVSSIQGRFRAGSPSYLSVQVPTLQYTNDIIDRSDGDIVVFQVLYVAGGEAVRQEIARVSLEDIRTDRGGDNRTVSLSGHKTETFGDQTITLQNVQESNESSGKKMFVSSVDLYLRPGHTVVYGATSFVAGLVSYSIGPRGEKMEVTEA